MTDKSSNEILNDKAAYKLLKECSAKKDLSAWNQFRKNTNNRKLNFRFKNLSNFYLADANLQNIDCRGANFMGADCKNADITGLNIKNNIYYLLFIVSFALVFMAFNVLNSDTVDTIVGAMAITLSIASVLLVAAIKGGSPLPPPYIIAFSVTIIGIVCARSIGIISSSGIIYIIIIISIGISIGISVIIYNDGDGVIDYATLAAIILVGMFGVLGSTVLSYGVAISSIRNTNKGNNDALSMANNS